MHLLVCHLWREMVINIFVLLDILSDKQQILTAINNAIVINKNTSKL